MSKLKFAPPPPPPPTFTELPMPLPLACITLSQQELCYQHIMHIFYVVHDHAGYVNHYLFE